MKRKLIALGLAIALIGVSVVSGTLAYLTDSDEAINVFTVGDVDITLTEEAGVYAADGVTPVSGKLVSTANGYVYKGIVPTNVLKKDVTVTNEGDTEAYVRVIITMNNKAAIENALKKATVADVFTGWGDTLAAGFAVNAAEGVTVIGKSNTDADAIIGDDEMAWVYYLKLEPDAVADVFDGLKSPAVFDKAENAMFDGLEIAVFADAIQVEGFATPDEAFKALEDAHPMAELNPAVEVSSVDELMTALELGGTIVLAKDITITADDMNSNPEMASIPFAVAIVNGQDVTIDLNGNDIIVEDIEGKTSAAVFVYNSNLTIVGDGEIKQMGTSDYVIWAKGDSNVDIMGGNFYGAGSETTLLYASANEEFDANSGFATINVYGGNFENQSASSNPQDYLNVMNHGAGYINIYGGTYNFNPDWKTYGGDDANYIVIPTGYEATQNSDGTYTVARKSASATITPDAGATKVENGNKIADVLNEAADDTLVELNLAAGEYKMPSVSGTQEFVISGTKETVIDITLGAYMDSATVSFEGVTIKGSTGKANGNGSDYAALYTPNVTYTNCTFDGPFRIGRDGAKFINCTFTNLGNSYVWTNGNEVTFENCTFESDGKALLIYSDGNGTVPTVTVKNCVFNATVGAKANAIANQNCAAIEIDNYGCGVNLITSGNTIDSDFSGEWRIKSYYDGKEKVIVNGTEYTSIALDGKTMTIDANKYVTVNG